MEAVVCHWSEECQGYRFYWCFSLKCFQPLCWDQQDSLQEIQLCRTPQQVPDRTEATKGTGVAPQPGTLYLTGDSDWLRPGWDMGPWVGWAWGPMAGQSCEEVETRLPVAFLGQVLMVMWLTWGAPVGEPIAALRALKLSFWNIFLYSFFVVICSMCWFWYETVWESEEWDCHVLKPLNQDAVLNKIVYKIGKSIFK